MMWGTADSTTGAPGHRWQGGRSPVTRVVQHFENTRRSTHGEHSKRTDTTDTTDTTENVRTVRRADGHVYAR